jgi:NTP pyrophosphatase (non-canonical NTP hydrolase)
MASSPETHTTLDEYQRVARETDKYVADDEKGLLVSLLGIAGESGQLLTGYKKRIRDGAAYSKFQSQIREELGDVLWYVANIASRLGLNLSEVAAHNLRKTRGRWLQGEDPSPQFFDEDEDWPEAQQLPRSFRFQYSTVRADGRSRVVLADADDPSKLLGNPLTDNAYSDDGYRFHDVIHLAFAVHLGWSPVVRSMLKRKRKNDLQIDEVEDGARAQIIEEAIVAAVYYYAEDNNFLDGARAVDWELLRTVKRLTADLEVKVRREADWERAIFSGIEIWRKVDGAKGGIVSGDLIARKLEYQPSPSFDKDNDGK